jgi:hypothetical protein
VIEVPEERMELYDRLKNMLGRAEALVNTHENVRIRIKAMEVAVKIASVMAGVLKDVQLDAIEKELEQLERAD